MNLVSSQLTIVEQGVDIREAVNKFLKKSSDFCGSEGCSKDCNKIIRADWPKNLVLVVPSSTKPQLSHNIIIDKSSTYDDKNRKYDLKSVVVHIGSEAGGHYYAYVKYGHNWYKCNDSAISLVDEAEVFSKNLGFQYLIYQFSE